MLAGVAPLAATEIGVDAVLGSVLAADVLALYTLPPWADSAMDGYAVRSADVTEASSARPVRLRVIGEVAAGHAATQTVAAGTAVRILTGAMLPPGADAVVRVEDTDAAPGVVALPESVGIRVSVGSRHLRPSRGQRCPGGRCGPGRRQRDGGPPDRRPGGRRTRHGPGAPTTEGGHPVHGRRAGAARDAPAGGPDPRQQLRGTGGPGHRCRRRGRRPGYRPG